MTRELDQQVAAAMGLHVAPVGVEEMLAWLRPIALDTERLTIVDTKEAYVAAIEDELGEVVVQEGRELWSSYCATLREALGRLVVAVGEARKVQS
jgi:hypothetical protein